MKAGPSLHSEFPCQFEVWDKENKCMKKCGKKPRITISVDDSDTKVGFCTEHYVDAVMQLQNSDVDIPTDVLKLLRKLE